jgi:hypothetical protein
MFFFFIFGFYLCCCASENPCSVYDRDSSGCSYYTAGSCRYENGKCVLDCESYSKSECYNPDYAAPYCIYVNSKCYTRGREPSVTNSYCYFNPTIQVNLFI